MVVKIMSKDDVILYVKKIPGLFALISSNLFSNVRFFTFPTSNNLSMLLIFRMEEALKKTSISGGFPHPPLMVSCTYRGFTGCLSPTYPFCFLSGASKWGYYNLLNRDKKVPTQHASRVMNLYL